MNSHKHIESILDKKESLDYENTIENVVLFWRIDFLLRQWNENVQTNIKGIEKKSQTRTEQIEIDLVIQCICVVRCD